MGDEDRSNFISANLPELTTFTVIGTEFVVSLRANKLINQEEMELLMNTHIASVTRSATLYTKIINKWTHKEFEVFKQTLEESGNARALKVFTEEGGDFFLKTEEFEVLKEQKKLKRSGCYEGLCYKDEEDANKVVELIRENQLITNTEIPTVEQMDRLLVNELLRNFLQNLKTGKIWWNPNKPTLPANYIPRNVCQINQFQSHASIPLEVELADILDVITEDLILLVDSPGMGKSTEVTKLQQNLKMKFPTSRIIVRINLNEVQRALSNISSGESVPCVLVKVAPFLPLELFQIPDIRFFVLLDGLDEVCPKHKQKMINLLRIFKYNQATFGVRVILSTRPHLMEAIEEEFDVESYSLLPLSTEQQKEYLQAQLNLTNEQLDDIMLKLPESLCNLTSTPLMLFMLADILKSETIISASDFNMFDLYFQFVESKHKWQLVQKEKMNEEDNFMEIRMSSVLSKCLPYYNLIAIDELADVSAVPVCKSIADENPTGLSKTELLSYGLLVEDIWGGLVFSHQSFGEFFYARFLLYPETTQETRDTLFGQIYEGYDVLENVESFLFAALTKEIPSTPLRLTSEWLLLEDYVPGNNSVLSNFVAGQLFSVLVREVLMTFVREEPLDFPPAFTLLSDRMSRGAFIKLVTWMEENSKWSRRHLFNLPDEPSVSYISGTCTPPQARLIVAISMIFDGQKLFTVEEVKLGLESCDRLLATVASIHTGKMTKWAFVERHLEGVQFRELVQKADHLDFLKIVDDVELVMKLFTSFSREELYLLISDEKNRVTDIIGTSTLAVFLSLGEEFLNPVTKFRAKFEDGYKGKTVFELDSCLFVYDYIWGDLVKEMEEKNEEGPVTTALREAIGKRASWEVLKDLENLIGRRRKCPSDSGVEDDNIIDWLVGRGSLWDHLTLFPLELLPFIVRYSGSLQHVTKAVQHGKQELIEKNDEETWTLLLKSLLLSCNYGSFGCFPFIATFIHDNIDHTIPPNLRSSMEMLIAATKEEMKVSLTPYRSHSLVPDVSLGQPFLRLNIDLTEKSIQATWRDVVCDIISSTRCCDISFALLPLWSSHEKYLLKILLSDEVLFKWKGRVFSGDMKREDWRCSLQKLLAFYFFTFGPCLEWMEEEGALVEGVGDHLVQNLQVEIAITLEGNHKWCHLVPQFELLVKTFFHDNQIDTVNKLAQFVDFKTEDEWMRLFQMLGEESFQPGPATDRHISSAYAAPLISACIRTFRLEAKNHLWTLWDQIPHNAEYAEDTPKTKASVLHSAIQLGELKQVERFAFPGIVSWRNCAGKNAFDVANEALGEDHPISVHTKKLVNAFCTKKIVAAGRAHPGNYVDTKKGMQPSPDHRHDLSQNKQYERCEFLKSSF